MLPGLEPYIARYYDVWLSYSRYICAQYGVLNEACDVVGDVMEDLCRKSDAVLADFLHEESQGNKKLRNYVKRMIQFKAIDAAKRRIWSVLTDSYVVRSIPDDLDQSPCTDAMREVEAALREDSFIIPKHTRRRGQIKGSIYIVFRGAHFRYRANVNRQIRKDFRSHHEAFQFLMSH